MGIRGVLRRVNDPSSVTHGVVSTALVTALAWVEPRKLSVGRRLAYRSAVAALAAWTMWASLRPANETDDDPLGTGGRVAATTGAAGVALGFADAGEAIDARLHDGLVRAGSRRPRVWLAAGEAAFSVFAWWTGRASERARLAGLHALDAPEPTAIEVPGDIRALALLLLSATDDHGAPQLRAQLASSKVIRFADEDADISFAQFDAPADLPLAVPGDATFPVIGRFRADENRTFDVRIFVQGGRLDSIHVDEGALPAPDEVELLVESASGYRPVAP